MTDERDGAAPPPDRTVIARRVGEPPPSAAPGGALTPAAGSPFVVSPTPAHGSPGALVGVELNDMFEITRFIAQGGMGEVYEGRNIASGERVAIKVILPQFASDEQFFALFKREASALERIGHDALVKYRALAFDRSRQLNYLAIEYVDGPALSDVIDGEPADPGVVKRLLRRLAAGLGAAHELGVIHRDLSPDNVLLPGGRLERAKIIDFGIAKDTNPGEKSVVGAAFAGKFGYAAPEIFGKFGQAVGPWTDVYSLALVVLAVAKGRPLDMGITIVDALDARNSVPDLSFLDPSLHPVFASMLEPDPARRPPTMEAVITLLDAGPHGNGASGVASPFAATSPGSIGGQSDAEASSPAFVRSGASTSSLPPTRSKIPVYIGGVVLAGLLIAGVFAFGGDDPEIERVDPPVEIVTAPELARVSWSVAQTQIEAALASVPCSDVRLLAPGSDGVVRLGGWRASQESVPAEVGGWRLDVSAVTSIAAPNPATCELIDALRSVVTHAAGFTMRAHQRISYGDQPGSTGSTFTVDLGLSDAPATLSELSIISIDDQPDPGEERVVSGDMHALRHDANSMEFERKPKRYLIAFVASDSPLAPANLNDSSHMRKVCGERRCALTSGWLVAYRSGGG